MCLNLFVGFPVILCGLDILVHFGFHDRFEVVADTSVRFFLKFLRVLLAPFFDDGMIDLLDVVFWDPLCWFLIHLFNVLDIPFYLIFIDAVIVFAIHVTDLCSVWFVSRKIFILVLPCLILNLDL